MKIAELVIKEDLTAEKEDEIEDFLVENKDKSWITIEVRANADNIKIPLTSLKDIVNLAEFAILNCKIKTVVAVDDSDEYEKPNSITIRFYDEEPIINHELILA